MGSKLRFPFLALVLTAGVVVLAGSATAHRDKTKVYRFLVTGKVLNGEQVYERQPDPSDQWTIGGSNTSSWTLRWRVRAVMQPGNIYSPLALNTSMTGSAKGEFHGGYPRPDPQPRAFYQCNWGPLKPQALIKKTQFYLTSRGNWVYLTFGVKTEPGILPKASCTGDPVDSRVPTTVTSGVFTGIESGCNPRALSVRMPARQLEKKTFSLKFKLNFGPHSPQGQSRPCNGFGSPVWAGGAGTVRFTFKRTS